MAIADEIAAIKADGSIVDKHGAIRLLKATRHRDQLQANLRTWLTLRVAQPSREVYIISAMVTGEGDLRAEFMARQGGVAVLTTTGSPFFVAIYRNPPVLDETKTENLIKVGRELINRVVPWPT